MIRWFLAGALVLTITPALAAKLNASEKKYFQHYDVDHDGQLSAKELKVAFREAQSFDYLDKDGNGLITAEEYPAITNADAFFVKTDENHDGMLTSAEYYAAVDMTSEGWLEMCDENIDDMIAPSELKCVLGPDK